MQIAYKIVSSPLGDLTIFAKESKLSAIFINKGSVVDITDASLEDSNPILVQVEKELMEYFRGTRTKFSIPLLKEGTEFQKQVWSHLEKIPYGTTISYGEVARRVGNPKASRAVGAANGKNPIPIVVPCHRVIGASGDLTGFSAGLDIKVKLLELEGLL